MDVRGAGRGSRGGHVTDHKQARVRVNGRDARVDGGRAPVLGRVAAAGRSACPRVNGRAKSVKRASTNRLAARPSTNWAKSAAIMISVAQAIRSWPGRGRRGLTPGTSARAWLSVRRGRLMDGAGRYASRAIRSAGGRSIPRRREHFASVALPRVSQEPRNRSNNGLSRAVAWNSSRCAIRVQAVADAQGDAAAEAHQAAVPGRHGSDVETLVAAANDLLLDRPGQADPAAWTGIARRSGRRRSWCRAPCGSWCRPACKRSRSHARSSTCAGGAMTVVLASPRLGPVLRAAKKAGHAFVVIDGTLIAIDRVAKDRPFYSGKHKKHGMNRQVISSPDGTIWWVSGPLPGSVTVWGHTGSIPGASVTPYSHAAGQRPGHPPDGAIRRGDDLPVHAVLLVLARVEGPVFGDPVDGDQGAVDDDERVPGFLRCAQHGTQPRRGEHDRHGATGAGTGSGVRPGAFTSWPTPRSARCSTPGSTATGSSCDSGPGCGVCLPRAVEQQIVRSGDERLDITSVPSWHSRLVRFSGSVTCASATAWTRVVHREEFHATALLRPLFDRFLGSWLTRGRATDAKCSRLLGMERPPALRMARDA